MKRVILLSVILFFTLGCKAQKDWEKSRDSLAFVSRTKADWVLNHFKDVKSPKLLYTLSDLDYYVLIIDEKGMYKEYYVTTDQQDEKTKVMSLKCSRKRNAKISQLKPFDFSKYHLEFITNISDEKYAHGKPSYFVVKDEHGNRFGEYYLPFVTLPLPIDTNLFWYFVKRLVKQIK